MPQHKVTDHFAFREEKNFNLVHVNFQLRNQRGLRHNVAYISSHCEN